jgi:hypothetical protein
MATLAVACVFATSPRIALEETIGTDDPVGLAVDDGLAWDSGDSVAGDPGATADELGEPDVELSPGGIQCTPVVCGAAPLPWSDADVRDALDGQPVMTQRIVFCEVGRSGIYDPYAVGSRGEIGPAQLLPGPGNGLAIFYRWGFTEPNNPYQAVAFINRVQREGMLGSQYPRTSRGCAGSV